MPSSLYVLYVRCDKIWRRIFFLIYVSVYMISTRRIITMFTNLVLFWKEKSSNWYFEEVIFFINSLPMNRKKVQKLQPRSKIESGTVSYFPQHSQLTFLFFIGTIYLVIKIQKLIIATRNMLIISDKLIN